MRGLCTAAACWLICSASIAFAQNYNQFVAFGDSTTDSGWLANPIYKLLVPAFDNATAAAVAVGGNAHWTGPGPNNSQILANFFGLTANPANTPGGTNYAIGGSFDSSGPGPTYTQYTNFNQIALSAPVPNPSIPSTSQQIDNYLASVGGHANPNALYLISSFGNDGLAAAFLGLSPAAALAYFQTDEQALANRVAALQAAGARYILVANQYGGFAGKLIEDNLWTDLAALNVKFIPADTNAVIAAVATNPAPFGIIFTSPTQPACTTVLALWCTTADLVSPNALQTHLFADSAHLTEAGQIIIADYYYSLLTAPSEISFLAETAVKARLGLVSSIQNQIELSESHRGPSHLNVWATGDMTSLKLENYHGFPGDPDTLLTGAAGVDYAIAPGLIAGIAISEGSLSSALGAFGSFKQSETNASLYAAYKVGPLWANVIGTYGHLSYDVNRNVPIGISVQNNSGATSGNDWSAAFQGGYKFWNGHLTHGPVAGFIYQNVDVGAFTEAGSFTSLAFGSQTRESDVGQLGYRASYDWAEYQPFLQATWNHEFADTSRSVTASLTTVAAPSYSLPAVILGKDWGEVKAGVAIDVGGGVKFMAVGSADFAQSSATVYGGQIGFNVAF